MAKFKGTAAANTIYGTALADFLDGGVGADTLIGGLGNDTYVFDNVNDTIIEANGTAGGIDTIIFNTFVDTTIEYLINIENITLIGIENVSSTGNSQNNVIIGNSGENTLYGLQGDDTIKGGAGNDALYANGSITVPKLETNLLYGDAGDDIIYGGIGTNSLFGGDGSDTLIAGYGNNVMAGGAGDDTYRLSIYNVGDPVLPAAAAKIKNTFTINESAPNGGIDTVEIEANATVSTPYVYVLGANLEAVNASFTSDRGFQLTGNALNNSIEGGGMNDTLNGGGGVDNLRGNMGDDTYVIDNTLDIIFEAFEQGTDTILLARTTIEDGGFYTLANHIENVTITNKIAYNVRGNTLDNVLTGNTANNVLQGGLGNDQLLGGAGNDALQGDDGNDYLDGGAGKDSLNGGLGNDTYVFDNVGDIISVADTGGIDTIIASTGVISNGFNVFNLNLDNHLAIENLTLTGSANIIVTGNNLGNAIFGNVGKNEIGGFEGDDFIDGDAGNDKLVGGLGFDTLNGGLGNDTLEGGGDTGDAFIFDTALSASNVDLIKGFNGDNKIILDSKIFTALAEAAGAEAPFATAGFTTVTGNATQGSTFSDFIVYNSETQTLYYDSDGAGGKASIAFAKFDSFSDAPLAGNFEISF